MSPSAILSFSQTIKLHRLISVSLYNLSPMESIASTALGFSLEDLKIDGSLQDELGVLPTSPQPLHP